MKLTTERLFDLSYQILMWANRDIPQAAFLEGLLMSLTTFLRCDAVILRLQDGKTYRCCRELSVQKTSCRFEIISSSHGDSFCVFKEFLNNAEQLAQGGSPIIRCEKGTTWINRTDEFYAAFSETFGYPPPGEGLSWRDYRSILSTPLGSNKESAGILQIAYRRKDTFKETESRKYGWIARMVGISLKNRHMQVALKERIKELTCLYNIMQLTDSPEKSLDEIFQGALELLPPAWQFPEAASARILFDDKTFSLPGFARGKESQSAALTVKGQSRGSVEVTYTEEKPILDEGPFLREERKLLENVSRELSLIIERKLNEEEKTGLLGKIHRADRLAIIGQLSAAVAHELNEPLANILGFAQLALKAEDLPAQPHKDLEKIQGASLHAREIINKLLAYARESPTQKACVNLNRILKETLYLFESRSVKEGITLEQQLDPDLPDISANGGQLMQVVTNLVVNAMQAMSAGDKLTVRTDRGEEDVMLIVEDTGSGMTQDIQDKIFTPFFTSKDPGTGTGLGLPVVHDIVIAHGGTIHVESEPGHGTRFEIHFPLPGPTEGEGHGT